jgi:hypothetical protein
MPESQPTLQSGFLLVKTFESLYRAFERPTPRHVALYSVPRRGLEPDVAPKKYRGIFRHPLWASSWLLGRRFTRCSNGRILGTPLAKRAASLAITYLASHGRAEDNFICSLCDALDVRSLLGNPEEWEIIWVARTEARVKPPPFTWRLGFEPSHFYPDHFSAVCDCLCFPKWHGTDKEGTLFEDHHARLNEHALFDSAEDAAAFLRFYLSHDWTETGNYSITEVRALPPRSRRDQMPRPLQCAVLDPGPPGRPAKEAHRPGGQGRDESTLDILLKSALKSAREGYLGDVLVALRDFTGLSSAETCALLEGLPKVIRLRYAEVTDVGHVQALMYEFAAAGIDAELVPADGFTE